VGDFEAILSGIVESPVKYHFFELQFLTTAAKTMWDSAWQAVLVGRYPPKK